MAPVKKSRISPFAFLDFLMGFNPQEEVRIMYENPIVTGVCFEETLREPKLIGTCHYRYCNEELYEGEGFEFGGYLYCSSGCIGEHLIEEGEVIDLSA